MIPLASSVTELTTAATDMLLAAIALGTAAYAQKHVSRARGQGALTALLGLLALGALIGAVQHAFDWELEMKRMLATGLVWVLAQVVALFVTCAIVVSRGKEKGYRAGPFLVLTGIAFSMSTVTIDGGFAVFLAYEGVAMLATLVLFALALRTEPAARFFVASVVISLVAAGIQATRAVTVDALALDHNGVFHIVQAVGVLALVPGLKLLSGTEASEA